MGRPKILIDNSYQQLLHSDIKKITDSDIVIKLKAISASLSNKESDVAIMYGISRSTLLRWISKYQKYGVEGLRSKKRGHYPEKLSKEEKAIIFKWISTSKDNSGKQVHWTLVRLIKEIFTVFGKEIGKTPLWLTLKKLNLTIKVPRPKHHKSNEEDQLNFKKTQIMINNLQEKENYKIMFFDEGRFGLRSTVMRVWAEKGKRLSVMVQQGFKNFYGFSSVCPFDGTNYSLLLPGVNTELMQYYIDNLSKEFSDKKIILFMDQAGWHKSRNLQIPENIRFEFLPAYSPELNPVEKLWQWIKKECLHNFIYNSLKELEDAVIVEFQKLTLSKYKKLCNCNYMSYFM